jgi:hypothetical protein
MLAADPEHPLAPLVAAFRFPCDVAVLVIHLRFRFFVHGGVRFRILSIAMVLIFSGES